MSSYVKISYKTKGRNRALEECIKFIGRLYGNNKKNDDLEAGITYLAKKVKGASRTSIKYMIESKKINNSGARQWLFKKNSYDRAYRYIVYRMLKGDAQHKEDALKLLKILYAQVKKEDPKAAEILSNILVPQQRDTLWYAIDKPQFINDQEIIKRILTCYEECNSEYK